MHPHNISWIMVTVFIKYFKQETQISQECVYTSRSRFWFKKNGHTIITASEIEYLSKVLSRNRRDRIRNRSIIEFHQQPVVEEVKSKQLSNPHENSTLKNLKFRLNGQRKIIKWGTTSRIYLWNEEGPCRNSEHRQGIGRITGNKTQSHRALMHIMWESSVWKLI